MTLSRDAPGEADSDVRETETVPWDRPPRRRQGPSSPVTPPLPVVASVLSRPAWLLTAAVLGAALGAALGGTTGYSADAVLQVSNPGGDSLGTTGAVVERRATSAEVIEVAAAARDVDPDELADRVTAAWEVDGDLVSVTAQAPDPTTAVADANAVAVATVSVHRASVQAQLSELRQDANLLLTVETLDDPDAESARRSALGQSFARRQDAVSEQLSGVVVADLASSASPTGLSPATGAVAGGIGGTLVGALAALLAGASGLTVSTPGRLRRLLPGVDVRSASQAAEVAGESVESDTRCVAVVTLPGAAAHAASIADDIAEHFMAHGLSARVVDVASLPTSEIRRKAIGQQTHTRLQHVFGSDAVVFLIDWRDDAFSVLAGQSAVRAVVVARRRQTRLRALTEALSRLRRARPVVVLNR